MTTQYTKPFDVGLMMGRFHIFHEGHKSIADLALSMCDRLLILVGSAQESGTLRNPFSIATRIEMIKEIYPGPNVIIRSMPDMTHEDDINTDWGRFVLKYVRSVIHKLPGFLISGDDDNRSGWFDKQDIIGMAQIIVSRSRIPISATELRTALLADDYPRWFKHHNFHLHKHYDRLRAELLACDGPTTPLSTTRVKITGMGEPPITVNEVFLHAEKS